MDTNFNYSYVINQKLAVDFNNSESTVVKLKHTHLIIYAYVKEFIASGACEQKGDFFWISYDKAIKDNPILDIEKKQMTNLFKDLCLNNILEFKLGDMSKTFWKRGKRFKELSFDYSNSDRVEINLQGGVKIFLPIIVLILILLILMKIPHTKKYKYFLINLIIQNYQ